MFPPLLRPRTHWACLVLLLLSPSAPLSSTPAPETRPWTRWWWPGSAVDPTGITAQLEAFAAAGLGGVEITPIYGARGAEDNYRPFLTIAWFNALEHTTREAARLGLQVDMATGTGWPFGGPWVSPAEGSQRLALGPDGRLTGKPTGMKVKRAAPGGEGLVVDPYSVAALQRYLAPIGATLDHLPAHALRAQFHDSFEYYGAEWTPRLLEVFQTDHGYDLNHHARQLLGEVATDPDTLARLKADYRTTLGRLHLDYLNTWRDWAHARGWVVRNQSHGAPANLLDLYGTVDIPETETFGSTPFAIPGLRRDETEIRGNDDLPEPLMMKMASSAAHVMGRPLVSSETCTWLREHWKVSLAMAKPEIDRLFVNGINHILYHGTVYSPPDAPWPGWLFYASTQFNPRNPWWEDFAALNAYVTRVQTVLQAGQPDNDILLYWPYADVIHHPQDRVQLLTVHHVDWLTQSPFGQTARTLAQAGYAFDYISDAQLAETVVVDGQLATPGHRYRVLVVPATRHMPVTTLQAIARLIESGGVVVLLDLPADVPGLGQLSERRAAFTALRDSAPIRGAVADNGLLPWLRRHAVPRESMADLGLEFVRRRTRSGHDYFITNLSANPVDDWVEIGAGAPSVIAAVDSVDPLSGERRDVPHRGDNHRRDVRLQLRPGQSTLLHVHRQRPDLPSPPSLWASRPAGPAVPLTGVWSLQFLRGGPELPRATSLSTLSDWTQLDDPYAQRFAGTARYRLEFELPAPPEGTIDWRLDLGDVRESARVILNGQPVATVWSIPYELAVGAHLQSGTNVLEIDVTNLAANRIRDLDRRGVEWRIMHEINFVNIHYQPFDASAWPLTPSGLLGPITLTPLTRP